MYKIFIFSFAEQVFHSTTIFNKSNKTKAILMSGRRASLIVHYSLLAVHYYFTYPSNACPYLKIAIGFTHSYFTSFLMSSSNLLSASLIPPTSSIRPQSTASFPIKMVPISFNKLSVLIIISLIVSLSILEVLTINSIILSCILSKYSKV
ncbi:taurine-binding periplasmic protein precursor [Clostridium tetani E88]|uniref:Taurine-binding periplasmic protein n=1 Tax=Clostridium tetani (strain Massachusetts / E88) TaxID=212717 RepID=Q895I9_CLOTE|nr:taurine-binding periplasmic protein precursor [Clostridium tetani E88]